jgi:hypothetical protein
MAIEQAASTSRPPPPSHPSPPAGLLTRMTPPDRAEVEAFAAFVLVRRHLQQPQLLTNDISVQELTELVAASGSFDWLRAEEEDIYTLEDGEAVQWPSP